MNPHLMDPAKAPPALLWDEEMGILAIRVEGRTAVCRRVLGAPPRSLPTLLPPGQLLAWLFS